MSPLSLALVVLAAFIHATWNLLSSAPPTPAPPSSSRYNPVRLPHLSAMDDLASDLRRLDVELPCPRLPRAQRGAFTSPTACAC